MAIDLSQLNPQQREAVEHDLGPLLVLAGAGSGKTRVVTYRTARLLASGVDASRILVVTFTNKAAAEMRARILAMVPKAVGRTLTLSTFHAFGLRLLRKYSGRVGYRSSFTILDTDDQVRLVKAAFDDLGLARSSANPKGVLRIISEAKRARKTPAGLQSMRFSPLLPYAQRVFDSYQQHLRALSAVDFDDLLALPIELCDSDEAVRERVAGQFDYVMVDEFQDTNTVQLELLRRVAGHGNLLAVGDDDQSIYGFQGALSDNILDFERYFPGARIIKLEQNYRSTGRILDAANAVIGRNRQRHAKRLWSARGSGVKLRYVSCANEREEAAFVAEDIRARHEEGTACEQIAVLYRINSQARLFEEALRLRRVPYRVVGSTELFDRAEVRDWLAYLKVIVNPRDDLSLKRILNVPRRGLGPSAAGRLDELAARLGVPLLEALRRVGELDLLSAAGRTGAGSLVSLLDCHSERLQRSGGAALAEAARAYLAETGLTEHIRRTEKNGRLAERRVETLERLVAGMADGAAGTSLGTYVSTVLLDTRSPDFTDDSGRGVTLLTLHSAKGLEFPRVYLVGFEKNLLPHRRSLERPSAIAEERRLCYVGMTRAMDRLTLTAARTRTRRNERLPRQPSPFLDEIPAELLEVEAQPAEAQPAESAQRDRNRAWLARVRDVVESGEPER